MPFGSSVAEARMRQQASAQQIDMMFNQSVGLRPGMVGFISPADPEKPRKVVVSRTINDEDPLPGSRHLLYGGSPEE